MRSRLCSQIINILSSASTRQKTLRRSLTFVVWYLYPPKTDSFPHSFHKCRLSKYFTLGSVLETHGAEKVRSLTWRTTIRAHGNLPMASSKPRCWRSSCAGMRQIWVWGLVGSLIKTVCPCQVTECLWVDIPWLLHITSENSHSDAQLWENSRQRSNYLVPTWLQVGSHWTHCCS